MGGKTKGAAAATKADVEELATLINTQFGRVNTQYGILLEQLRLLTDDVRDLRGSFHGVVQLVSNHDKEIDKLKARVGLPD